MPPFLLPIFQAAGTAYRIPWQVLAAINEVETDYGRDLSVSSAGAEGWMQFLPSEWAQYGVDANGDGWEDPYNPADAIFAAAKYLRAAGGNTNIKAAIFSYNHSQAYVESVMLRAQLLGGTPSELLGAITGLTEARFPVHAAAHYSDGFPTLAAHGTTPVKTLVGTTIYSQVGAPVIAVADSEVVQVGDSPSLGHFLELRDAYGNTYVYAQLGEVSSVYPVLEPHVHSAPSPRIARRGAKLEPSPAGPATAGAQPRSPLSEGAAVSGLALGAAAGLESIPPASVPAPATSKPTHVPAPARTKARVRVFTEGVNDVYLHPLVAGVQVIAGTVLGHVGAATGPAAAAGGAHILFQIRPGGAGAPLIDPKPILDGWVSLEDTSIFRAKGENPFLATSPTVGQVLLESKQQLEPQVLHDAGIHLGALRTPRHAGGHGRQACARDARVPVRVRSAPDRHRTAVRPGDPGGARGQRPREHERRDRGDRRRQRHPDRRPPGGGLDRRRDRAQAADARGPLAAAADPQPDELPGRPRRASTSASAADAIKVTFGALPGAAAGAHAAALSASGLTPSEWIELIDAARGDPRPDRRQRPLERGDPRRGCSPARAGKGKPVATTSPPSSPARRRQRRGRPRPPACVRPGRARHASSRWPRWRWWS